MGGTQLGIATQFQRFGQQAAQQWQAQRHRDQAGRRRIAVQPVRALAGPRHRAAILMGQVQQFPVGALQPLDQRIVVLAQSAGQAEIRALQQQPWGAGMLGTLRGYGELMACLRVVAGVRPAHGQALVGARTLVADQQHLGEVVVESHRLLLTGMRHSAEGRDRLAACLMDVEHPVHAHQLEQCAHRARELAQAEVAVAAVGLPQAGDQGAQA